MSAILIPLLAVLCELPANAEPISSGHLVTRPAVSRLSVSFVPNAGQFDPAVAFSMRLPNGAVSVMRDGRIAYALGRSGLTEHFSGGSSHPEGGERTETEVSFFLGTDPGRWRSGLPTYDSVHLGEVWPGVQVSLHPNSDSIEKIFALAPSASPELIRVQVGGAERLRPGPDGSLLAVTPFGNIELTAPVAYQIKAGKRLPVSVAYRLQRGSEYGFRLGAYDPNLPVVIDPLLQSTYLGEFAGTAVHDIAVHPATGDVYVAGTAGPGFPGTAGGAQPTGVGAFVARLNTGLTRLIQATYVGGSGWEEIRSLAIAPDTGDIVVTGSTASTDFPITAGAAQPALGGGTDAFIVRLNAELTGVLRSTYFGGRGSEDRIAIALHPVSGDVLITGLTFSTGLPGVAGGAQSTHGGGGEDAFVARLDSALTTIQRATYAGGSGSDFGEAIAIDPSSDEILVTGSTYSFNFPGTAGGAFPMQANPGSFVARFTPGLTNLSQATYIGGIGFDDALDLVVHPSSGDVLITGLTNSPDFPGTVGGAQPVIRSGHADVFVARFNASLRALRQATYLGGSESDEPFDIAFFPGGSDILVAGITSSQDFPGTTGGAQSALAGGRFDADAFGARLTADLTQLRQATYLGGSRTELPLAAAVSPSTGDVYLGGYTDSYDFPRTAGGIQQVRRGDSLSVNGYVARLTGDLSSAGGQSAAVPALSRPALALLAIFIATCGLLILGRR